MGRGVLHIPELAELMSETACPILLRISCPETAERRRATGMMEKRMLTVFVG